MKPLPRHHHLPPSLLEGALENMGDALVVLEADPLEPPGPRVVYVNPAFEAMTGHTDAAPVGQAPGENWYRALEDTLRKAHDCREPVHRVLRLERGEGRAADVETEVRPICDATGRPTHLCVLHRDPAERGNVLDALRESEAWFRAAFMDAAIGFAVATPEGTILDVNDAFCALTGYGAAELHATPFHRLIHPEDLQENQAQVRAVLAGERKGVVIENRYQRKDGTPLWVRKSIGAIRDAHGAILRLVVVVEDITERRDAEQARIDSETRLRIFIEHAPAAVAMFDRNMCYVAASRRWKQDYGLSDDIVGKSQYALFPEIPERWRRVHARGLAGEVVKEEEDPFVRADGSTQWAKWEVHPWRDANGAVGGILIAAEEITARVQAQHALRESEARLRLSLEAADAAPWQWDIRTGETIWSPETYRLFDVDFDPTRPSPRYEQWLSLIHPEDRVHTDRAVHDAVWGDAETLRVEFRIVGRDGAVRWLQSLAQVERDPARAPLRMVGLTLDVTERKEAEGERQRLKPTHGTVTLEVARRVALDVLRNREDTGALRHIVRTARTLTSARTAVLAVVSADGEGFQSVFAVGMTAAQKRAVQACSPREGVFGLLLSRREPLRFGGADHRPVWAAFPPGHPETEAFLGVPLWNDDEVMGCLYLTNRPDDAPFTEAEATTVAALADYAAVAIHFQRLLAGQTALMHEFVNTLEEERRSIAYELHDGVVQYVMSAHTFLDTFADQSCVPDGERGPLDDGLQLLKKAVVELRRIVSGLRALALEDLGLIGALEQLILEERQRAGWSTSTFRHDVRDRSLSLVLETAVYRVAQEALANVRKHARAPGVEVCLRHLPGTDTLVLEVRDRGVGFDLKRRKGFYGQLGLHSMAERVRLMNGSFTLSSKPGEGTRIRAEFPIAPMV